jgi:2-methylcitrate dehydratase PrpD
MCNDPEPERILEHPNADWQLCQTSIKPWPCCRHTHPIIDCALEIHQLLDGNQVNKIDIKTYQAALDVCDCPTPESEYQAKFSLYHTAAIAILDGAVGLDSFDANARQRSKRLRRKTTVSVVEPYASNYPVSWGAEVTVATESGASCKISRKDCKGDPELALDDDEMRVKAMGLLQFGGLDESRADQLCNDVLAMPSGKHMISILSDFIRHLEI